MPEPLQVHTLQRGYRVASTANGGWRHGRIEFAPAHAADVLVAFDDDALVWVPAQELQVLEATKCDAEREEVRSFRDHLQAIALREGGRGAAEISRALGRPVPWVEARMRDSPAEVPKPKGMEHWDAAGFTDVQYVRGYVRRPGLYERVVQGVEWQQDLVWRVHKAADNSSHHLRTVKECGACRAALRKVPDTTRMIGPNDRHQKPLTATHGDWICRAQGPGCERPDFAAPLREPYWCCPRCNWYLCDPCCRARPDRATSKQICRWRPGECRALDDLVMNIVHDFRLPDPRSGYTIKMNWYPDGLARVSPHRHDCWTLLLSLGAPRVLTVDRARVLMEDGDLVLFGTQQHGVPEMPEAAGGRLSLVFMFAPDPAVRAAATAFVLRHPAADPPAEGEARALEESEEVMALVPALCALGFGAESARAALARTGGDADRAALLLLNGQAGPGEAPRNGPAEQPGLGPPERAGGRGTASGKRRRARGGRVQ